MQEGKADVNNLLLMPQHRGTRTVIDVTNLVHA